VVGGHQAGDRGQGRQGAIGIGEPRRRVRAGGVFGQSDQGVGVVTYRQGEAAERIDVGGAVSLFGAGNGAGAESGAVGEFGL